MFEPFREFQLKTFNLILLNYAKEKISTCTYQISLLGYELDISGSSIFGKTGFQMHLCIQRLCGDNTEGTSMILQGLLFRAVTVFHSVS